MNGFCVDTIAPEANLRPQDGVLRTEALAVTSDARRAAEHILRRARAEADVIVQDAREEAGRLTQQAERQTLERATDLLQALEEANLTLLSRAQDMVVDLVQSLYDRLIQKTSEREQIEASLKRILREAPPRLVDPVLRVHPDDVELVPQVEWEVKPDLDLPRGVCRLEAGDGEWRADFSAAVEALREAFSRNANGPGVDSDASWDRVSTGARGTPGSDGCGHPPASVGQRPHQA